MAWGSHISLVARGRKFQTRLGGSARLTGPSPEVPTEPESSPPRPGRHLHRTRALPARFRDSIYLELKAPPVVSGHNQAPSPGRFLQPRFESIYTNIF